jgi:hypothetical protein
MTELIFDEALHQYSLVDDAGGVRVIPSVTQILRDNGFINTDYVKPEDLERGKDVHKITELYDLDKLDEDTVDESYMGYFEAWKKFKKEKYFSPTAVEVRTWHKTYLYAGTLDRYGLIKDTHAIIDIKTSETKQKWWGLQLAAYNLCFDVEVNRYSVQLYKDGKYKLTRCQNNKECDHVFLAAMTLRNWKINNKIKIGG